MRETGSAVIYVMRNEADGQIKVGRTKFLTKRAAQVARSRRSNVVLEYSTAPSKKAVLVEKTALRELRHLTGQKRGEWFLVDVSTAILAVQRALDASHHVAQYKPLRDVDGVLISMRLPVEMTQRIDAECAARLDSPTRSVMIRELLAEALAARAKKR